MQSQLSGAEDVNTGDSRSVHDEHSPQADEQLVQAQKEGEPSLASDERVFDLLDKVICIHH